MAALKHVRLLGASEKKLAKLSIFFNGSLNCHLLLLFITAFFLKVSLKIRHLCNKVVVLEANVLVSLLIIASLFVY